MPENTSPFLGMQDVERQLKGLLRTVAIDLLAADEQKAVANIRRLATDARLDIRDYEFSDTRAEQLKCAAAARKRIVKLRTAILGAGAAFGPADVAQLDAQLDQINSRLA